MNISISKLDIKDFHKCSNIWDIQKHKSMADKFYNEILSGNRETYIYSIDGEYIAEIALVFETGDEDYTLCGKRVYISRLVVKKSFRRRGIGRELVKFIKLKAKELGFFGGAEAKTQKSLVYTGFFGSSQTAKKCCSKRNSKTI